MKLSIVIICWNDMKVIGPCLESIHTQTSLKDFEVIVSDNGSTDGSVEFIRAKYPAVRVLENRANLGFGGGNNVGIRASQGEHVLILNPDTIVHSGALDSLVRFADHHPEAAGFGCRVLNPDGSYQSSSRPFPSVKSYWLGALCLGRVGRYSKRLLADEYPGWERDAESTVDWITGCCAMFRRSVLWELNGFDEQFFYHFEEVDLCKRVSNTGHLILFTPEPRITHIGGQSVGRFPIRFELEKLRNCYRYFYKHYGVDGCRGCRRAIQARFRTRQIAYRLLGMVKPSDSLRIRLDTYRIILDWNKHLDPVRFVKTGEEPRAFADAPAQAV